MIENSADVNDVTLQLSDLRKTLESRTTELDAEKEAVMKLQRYVTAMFAYLVPAKSAGGDTITDCHQCTMN